MIHQPTERQRFFIERIGKTVYRNENGCPCPACKEAMLRGIVITDKMHADYLYDNECDYNREGTPLRYFDTKKEVDEWLKTLNEHP